MDKIHADNFPPLDGKLLRALDTLYPEKCAKLGDSIEEIMFYSGQRDLIKFLHKMYEFQTNRNKK